MMNRPWLWLPSKLAHDLTPYLLPLVSNFTAEYDNRWASLEWRGLHFANPLGIAGGVDKSGRCLGAWKRLGVGFLEVGTITPEAQAPNPGTIMSRDTVHEALWNKMGFPNVGADALVARLAKFQKNKTPLFINIGKNRWTKNEKAYKDYALCMAKLSEFADAFVVNLSSPNTEGLRDLLREAELKSFLNSLLNESSATNKKPTFLKLSPDMDTHTLSMALEVSIPYVDGWILTNTTKQRFAKSHFPETEGGVSGVPLIPLAQKALEVAAPIKKRHPEKLLVSVGGINSADEILQRLEMGADLVQFYTALVFQGPFFVRNSLIELQQKKAPRALPQT